MIGQDDLVAIVRSSLSYNPQTGEIRWGAGRRRAGKIAGALDSKGHRQIRIRGRLYLAHRLIWLIVHGRWPVAELDHINRDRADNRLTNLRECSHAENMRNHSLNKNNTTGTPGVHWYKKYQKYIALIRVNGKSKNLGYFDTLAEAIDARNAAVRKYYGQFGVVFSDQQGEAA